jgi:CRP-like cAMP-binding protein
MHQPFRRRRLRPRHLSQRDSSQREFTGDDARRSAWQDRLRTRLDALPLFAHLPEAVKVELSKRIRRRRYWRAGRAIVRQGAPGDSMLMILKGEVSFWQQAADIPPAQVAPPDDRQAFGELSLLTGAARLFTVKSAAAASLGELRKRDLLPLLRKQPALVNAFSAELTRLRLLRENREDPAHAPQLDQAALTAEFRAQINRFFGLRDSQ